MLRMCVTGIHLDPSTGSAVLMLTGDDDRVLPILIGLAEATSIAKELEDVDLPRPLTHDLLRDVIQTLGARVIRVEIIDLRDDTYFAEVVLGDASGKETRLDSRPSDAVAVAVRVDAPIFVHEQVMQKTQPQAQEILGDADKERWKKILEEMDPEDFGKYKM
jgi:bifunctional DNase/RNase